MRKLLGTALCALVVVLAVAERAEAQSIGFKLGPTFSNIDSSDDDDSSSTLTSFGGGGFVRFGFSGLALQLEVLALTKGARIEDPDTDDNVKLKMDYIEVPLTAMFSLGSGGPYVFGGPVASFEIGCSAEAEFGEIDVSADCDDDDAPTEGDLVRKKTLFGATVGLGMQFPAGPGSVLIEGRHTWNFTNLIDDDGDDSAKHRQFAIFAGYSIPLSR